jgi:hypothetical protein
MSNPYDEYIGDEESVRSRSRRSGAWLWGIVLVLGFLVYEATASPAWTAFIVCVKFGWDDVKSARWLWRIDPDRGRAAVAAGLHLALASLKIAVSGLVMMWGLVLFTTPPQPPPGGPPPVHPLVGVVLAMVLGFGFTSMATGFALLVAWARGVKVFLSARMHGARNAHLWPSSQSLRGDRNHAGSLWAVTLGLGCLAAVLASAIVARGAFGVPQRGLGRVVGITILALAPLTKLAYWYVTARLLAATPEECWGKEPAEFTTSRLGSASDGKAPSDEYADPVDPLDLRAEIQTTNDGG